MAQVHDRGGRVFAVHGFHVSEVEFAGLVASFLAEEATRPVKWFRHDWQRAVPGAEGTTYHSATPHSRGAFRVTIGELEPMSTPPSDAEIEAQFLPRLHELAVSMATLGLRDRLAAGEPVSAEQALAYLEEQATVDLTSAASAWVFYMQQRNPSERQAFAAAWDAELAARAAKRAQEARS